jgi:elongator complex protein 3
MLGLPGASYEDDEKMLSETLWLSHFSPDFLKIYPCILLKDDSFQPALHDLYRSAQWSPPSVEYTKRLLQVLGDNVPSFVRISRIQRFIPSHLIEGEFQKGLRENLFTNCECVRCREAGRVKPHRKLSDIDEVAVKITKVGDDTHIEIVTNDNTLLALARLYDVGISTSVLRELHVYGVATPIGEKGFIQGNGLGEHLLKLAENEAFSTGKDRLFVNAAPGARTFFRKNGYHDSGGFLCRRLQKDLLGDTAFPLCPTFLVSESNSVGR